MWDHSDATVNDLPLDTTGRVTWWQDAEVPLFNILVHVPAETSRHAGHADILRETLDGAVGTDAEAMTKHQQDPAFWAERRDEIEAACQGCGVTPEWEPCSSRSHTCDRARMAAMRERVGLRS